MIQGDVEGLGHGALHPKATMPTYFRTDVSGFSTVAQGSRHPPVLTTLMRNILEMLQQYEAELEGLDEEGCDASASASEPLPCLISLCTLLLHPKTISALRLLSEAFGSRLAQRGWPNKLGCVPGCREEGESSDNQQPSNSQSQSSDQAGESDSDESQDGPSLRALSQNTPRPCPPRSKPRSRLSAGQWQSAGRKYTSNIRRRLSTVELKSKAFLTPGLAPKRAPAACARARHSTRMAPVMNWRKN
eukprot:1193633-Prorocentrum_minimum.AAC.4